MLKAILKGFGGYLPERVMKNSDLEKMVETSNEWIVTRTGIEERRIAAQDETTSDMAFKAGEVAIKNSGLEKDDIDGIIVATTTPDLTFPSTAVLVQSKLGIKKGFAFDMQAVCSGFVYAMTVANSLIKSSQAKNILVIGADKLSCITDWTDRNTCVLFGDGAGAVVLSAEETEKEKGILSTSIYSDGSLSDLLKTTGGVSTTQTAGFMTMQGREVFKHATNKMSGVVIESLEKAGYEVKDMDWLVPHQANLRILQAVAKKLKFPEEKVVATLTRHANTSAASIPLALWETSKEGKFEDGQLIVLEALGGGLTWGSLVVRL